MAKQRLLGQLTMNFITKLRILFFFKTVKVKRTYKKTKNLPLL